jgi:hypothetical protein
MALEYRESPSILNVDLHYLNTCTTPIIQTLNGKVYEAYRRQRLGQMNCFFISVEYYISQCKFRMSFYVLPTHTIIVRS